MRTGRYRFKKTVFGDQVLEVEHQHPNHIGGGHFEGHYRTWDRATPSEAQDVLDMIMPKATRVAKEACPIDLMAGGWHCLRCKKQWEGDEIPFDKRVCGDAGK